MDDGFWFALIIIGIIVSVSAGIIIHETLESDYNKCLDACGWIEAETLQVECAMSCTSVRNDYNITKEVEKYGNKK